MPRPVPSSHELTEAFAGRSVGGQSHLVLTAGRQLAQRHLEQWAAEDACRDHVENDKLVARAKRAIDQMNAERSRLIDEIDAWAAQHLSAAAGATLHTETLGLLVDRLAVAWIRSRQLTQCASHNPSLDATARRAIDQLTELCAAFDALVEDLRRGRRRLPDWRTLKSYGAARQPS